MRLPRWEVLIVAVFTFTFSSAAQANGSKIQLVAPLGTIQREGVPIPFSWQPLSSDDAVKKYELTLYLLDQTGGKPRILNRATVSADADPTVDLGGILSTGKYIWAVKAKNEKGDVLGTGQARFTIVSEIFRRPGKLTAVAGFSYLNISYSSKISNIRGDVPADFFGYVAAVEYQLPSSWVAFASYLRSTLSFSGQSLPYSELGLGGMRRSKLGSSDIWHLNYGLKLSKLTVPQLTPQANETFLVSAVDRTMVTPSLGVDYLIAQGTTVFTRLGVGVGLSTSNSTHEPLSQVERSMSYLFSGGIRGLFKAPWGYSLETTYMIDNYGYTTGSQVLNTSYRGYHVQLLGTRYF